MPCLLKLNSVEWTEAEPTLEKSTKSTAAGSLEETERNRTTDVEKILTAPPQRSTMSWEYWCQSGADCNSCLIHQLTIRFWVLLHVIWKVATCQGRTVEEGLMAVEESWELTRWWREGVEAELSSLPTLLCSVVGFKALAALNLSPMSLFLPRGMSGKTKQTDLQLGKLRLRQAHSRKPSDTKVNITPWVMQASLHAHMQELKHGCTPTPMRWCISQLNHGFHPPTSHPWNQLTRFDYIRWLHIIMCIQCIHISNLVSPCSSCFACPKAIEAEFADWRPSTPSSKGG